MIKTGAFALLSASHRDQESGAIHSHTRDNGFEHPCPRCEGTGTYEFYTCGRCDGEGYLDD